MKKLIVLWTAVLIYALGMVFTTLSIAEPKGNPRKGKYLFRQNCLKCHAKNPAEKENGIVVQPSSKTQEEWQRTFQDEAYKGLKCVGKWEKLSGQDINDVYLFLFSHASDSPTPLTCSDR